MSIVPQAPETPQAPPQVRGAGPGARILGLLRAPLLPLLAAAIAFASGAVIILATGQDPVVAYSALLRGAFGSRTAMGRTLLNATPLVFTGLAVALPFRAGLFNLGGAGQFALGAVATSWLAIALPGPGWLVVIVAVAAAGLVGFAWGAVPGLLKIRGAHEVITTVLLNFVAVNLAVWLVVNPLDDVGSPIPGTAAVVAARRVAPLGLGLGRAHWGLVLGLLAALAAWLLLARTTRGFELRAVGLSPAAARYAGMPLAANGVLALAIGGLFAGLGGGLEVLGVDGRLTMPLSSTLGFTGIGVALLGRNSPLGVVFGALFFGAVAGGAQEMALSTDVPPGLADVLLAVVVLLVTTTRPVELLVGRRAHALASGIRLERGLA